MSNNYWYFIFTGSNNAVYNMAFDNYFFNKLASNELNYPLLRLYCWSEPSLSLGANQFSDLKSINSVREENIVRRLTGGQAVFHGTKENEITYSVVIKSNVGFRKVYDMISDAIIYFLKLYELDPVKGYSGENYFNDFNCFNSNTEADIVVNRKKVVGSAQYRKSNCILQHGSIKLNDIAGFLDKKLTIDEILSKLKLSFKKALDIDFLDYSLNEVDCEKINNICEGMDRCKAQV